MTGSLRTLANQTILGLGGQELLLKRCKAVLLKEFTHSHTEHPSGENVKVLQVYKSRETSEASNFTSVKVESFSLCFRHLTCPHLPADWAH